MKLKNLYNGQDTFKRTEGQTTELKKIFTNPTSDRDLISEIHIELKKLYINKPNNTI